MTKRTADNNNEEHKKQKLQSQPSPTRIDPLKSPKRSASSTTEDHSMKIFGSTASLTSFAAFKPKESLFNQSETNTFKELTEGNLIGTAKQEQKVQVQEMTTGEEDEETLFNARCKLFVLEDENWKERGIGQIKVNANGKNKYRLVMRTEGVLKVVLNANLFEGMGCFVPKEQENFVRFVAIEEGDVVQYAVKFKNKGIAGEAASLVQRLTKPTERDDEEELAQAECGEEEAKRAEKDSKNVNVKDDDAQSEQGAENSSENDKNTPVNSNTSKVEIEDAEISKSTYEIE